MFKKYNQEQTKKVKMNQNRQIGVISIKNNTKVVSEDMMTRARIISKKTNMVTIEITIVIEADSQKVMIKMADCRGTNDARETEIISNKIKLIRTRISESTISMTTNFTKQ